MKTKLSIAWLTVVGLAVGFTTHQLVGVEGVAYLVGILIFAGLTAFSITHLISEHVNASSAKEKASREEARTEGCKG